MSVDDLSTDLPIDSKPVQWTEEWWAQASEKIVRCVGHRKNGNRCKHAALNGGTVCAYHGGRAPQVKQRAKVRLEEATNKLAGYLLDMASDTTIPESVRLQAIRDGLDRGGLGAKQSMDIEVTAKPFEKVFEKIMTGPRNGAEYVDAEEDEGSLKARLALKMAANEYSDIED